MKNSIFTFFSMSGIFIFILTNNNAFTQVFNDSICNARVEMLRDSILKLDIMNKGNREKIHDYQDQIKELMDSLAKSDRFLRGYIEDQNGNPAKRIRIQLKNNSAVYAKTDDYGFFRLNLPVSITDSRPVRLDVNQRGWSALDTNQFFVSVKRHPDAYYILQDRVQITLKHDTIRFVLLLLEYELGKLKPRSFVQDQLQESLIKNQFEVYDMNVIWPANQINKSVSSFKKGDYRAIIDETKNRYDFLLVGTVETIESKTGSVNPYGESSGRVSCWGSVSLRLINLKDTSVYYVFSRDAVRGISVGDVAKASIMALKNVAAESMKFMDEFYSGNN